MSDFIYPSEFRVKSMTIDGEEITQLYTGLEIFENIFIPAVSGKVTFIDIDGAGFVEENEIEFNEPFEFSIENSQDQTMKFTGVLNGLAHETSKDGKKVYTVDFTTEELRTNEKTFVSEKFQVAPQEVVEKMVQEVQGTLNSTGASGENIEFVASRWKPLKIINYVLKHAVSGESQAPTEESGRPTEDEAKGTTGFLCWQTIGEQNEYRFCTVNELLDGAFETHSDYQTQLMNKDQGMEQMNKAILDYDFKDMGDIQTKMRSGAFHSINVSFDMDTGEYKEFIYDGRDGDTMSEKQKEIVDAPTRILLKPFQNDKFAKDCSKADPDSGDQSRLALAQGHGRQNTFNDQTGHMTFYCNFDIHAGDILDVKINKIVSGDSDGTTNDKHSGKYVVKQVGHHFTSESKGYSRVTTIRASNQQDKFTAK